MRLPFKSLWAEFKAFALKGNMIDLAVAVVIGGAFGTVIKAVVDDAVRFAEQSPATDPETVADYVFAPDGPIAFIGEPGADDPRYVNALDTRTGKPFTTVSGAQAIALNAVPEEVARR